MIVRTILILIIFYVVICILLYFLQEKLIFFPEKLDKEFRFQFDQPFTEVNVTSKDGKLLNGILFNSKEAKGLVFYLHGNAGSLNSWGEVANTYTALNYDVFMLDYPGYGKSEGSIRNQQQLFEDIQTAYNEVKKKYREENIVVLGYSIGTGPASKIASTNHPKLLILQAPFYNLTDVMKSAYPILPTFLLKYKFNTNEYIKGCQMPVVIFHGDRDEVIHYNSSIKLKREMKKTDTLITLRGQGHNGITNNPEYIAAIGSILATP